MLLARESVNSGLLFDLEKLDKEIEELTIQSEKEDFWNNQKSALKVISADSPSSNIEVVSHTPPWVKM